LPNRWLSSLYSATKQKEKEERNLLVFRGRAIKEGEKVGCPIGLNCQRPSRKQKVDSASFSNALKHRKGSEITRNSFTYLGVDVGKRVLKARISYPNYPVLPVYGGGGGKKKKKKEKAVLFPGASKRREKMGLMYLISPLFGGGEEGGGERDQTFHFAF